MSGDTTHGLGVIMAIIFLSGEMAGVGVLKLPDAMSNTGPAGLALLLYFTVNAMFVATRLGLCWIMVEERYPEYKEGCRDPYMVIAEKAGASRSPTWSKVFSFLQNIFHTWDLDMDTCYWVIIVAAGMLPLCLLGTPADLWFVAVFALISTLVGCGMIMVKEGLDTESKSSCYYDPTLCQNGKCGDPDWVVNRPNPQKFTDFGKAFSSIMFAFAGASTFPTIQADMKDKSKFPRSAVFAMLVLFSIYMSMSAVSWGLLGDRVSTSVVESLCDGPVKVTVEILFLIHVIAAFPILMNPPTQLFEDLLNLPTSFGLKRVIFRSLVLLLLLLIALSVPVFGLIVDLIGSTTITCLNFIFPPIFYLFLADSTKDRRVSIWVRVYCWHMIIVGLFGGGLSFYKAVDSAVTEFSDGVASPCWVLFFQ